MKALSEYFLMVVFTLLLNRVHVFANFMFNLDRETALKWSTTLPSAVNHYYQFAEVFKI